MTADSSFHACPQLTLFALYNSKTSQLEIGSFENKSDEHLFFKFYFSFPWLPCKITLIPTIFTYLHRKSKKQPTSPVSVFLVRLQFSNGPLWSQNFIHWFRREFIIRQHYQSQTFNKTEFTSLSSSSTFKVLVWLNSSIFGNNTGLHWKKPLS